MTIPVLTLKTEARLFVASLLFLLVIPYVGVSVAAPANITGANIASVTEDVDPDGDNLLEVGGKLSVTDPDPGESLFKPSYVTGRYGALYINSLGNWRYAVSNNLAVVQNLVAGQFVTDNMAVSSIDGTRRNLTVFIIGADDPTNSPAVIGGITSGSVTKDVDPDGDNLLEASGTLTVTDVDQGESNFNPSFVKGSFGTLYINAMGRWSYAVKNDLGVVQNLTAADSVQDTLVISSIDGTTQDVVITINGADDGLGGGQNGGITLRWSAPAQREDGSALSMAEIAGYRVYYGATQGSYTDEVVINTASTMNVTLSDLAAGTYYIVVTAVDVDGRESAFSREVVRSL